mmetsp:Transcript_98017/g.255448  ORF Transcript_98017/g.255448 Transcript_98017/m.255448 type:complete len:422 (+) Transcript_98017:183-1448(+)
MGHWQSGQAVHQARPQGRVRSDQDRGVATREGHAQGHRRLGEVYPRAVPRELRESGPGEEGVRGNRELQAFCDDRRDPDQAPPAEVAGRDGPDPGGGQAVQLHLQLRRRQQERRRRRRDPRAELERQESLRAAQREQPLHPDPPVPGAEVQLRDGRRDQEVVGNGLQGAPLRQGVRPVRGVRVHPVRVLPPPGQGDLRCPGRVEDQARLRGAPRAVQERARPRGGRHREVLRGAGSRRGQMWARRRRRAVRRLEAHQLWRQGPGGDLRVRGHQEEASLLLQQPAAPVRPGLPRQAWPRRGEAARAHLLRARRVVHAVRGQPEVHLRVPAHHHGTVPPDQVPHVRDRPPPGGRPALRGTVVGQGVGAARVPALVHVQVPRAADVQVVPGHLAAAPRPGRGAGPRVVQAGQAQRGVLQRPRLR